MRLLTNILIATLFFFFSCKTVQQKKPTETVRKTTTAAPVRETTAEIASVTSKYLDKDSSYITVFMKIEMRKGRETSIRKSELIGRFMLNYVVYPDFSSRERLVYANVPLNDQNVSQIAPSQFILSFDVKKPLNQLVGILLAEFTEIGGTKKVQDQLNLRFKPSKLSDSFALFDKDGTYPLMRNYVNVNDTVSLISLAKKPKKVYVYYYSHDFDAAAPPMSLSMRGSSKTLRVDTVLTMTIGRPMVFRNEGLYFMLDDTTASYGIGIVVANKRFPKFTRPEELARPVMYMSLNQEILELFNSRQPKKALDKYWLNLSNGNPDVARRNIKAYYQRVEEANRYFTTYKEGWKTDKGMIYIVMGAPDRITRGKEREVWVYSQRANFSEVNFTFNRRPNQFVEDHYELQRYVEYKPIWEPMVEARRSGASH